MLLSKRFSDIQLMVCNLTASALAAGSGAASGRGGCGGQPKWVKTDQAEDHRQVAGQIGGEHHRVPCRDVIRPADK